MSRHCDSIASGWTWVSTWYGAQVGYNFCHIKSSFVQRMLKNGHHRKQHYFDRYDLLLILIFLKDHFVGPVVLLQRKVASKIWLHQRSWFHRLQNLSIHFLLICLTLVTDNGRFGSIIFKEFLLSTGSLRLHTSEVGIIDIGNVDLAHIDLGRSGNNIGLVDSAKRNAINFVRSGDEQKSRFQRLQAHNTLSTETPTEEDANGSWGEGGTNTGRVVLLCPGVFWSGDVVGGVVARRLARGGGSLHGLLGTGNSEYTLSVVCSMRRKNRELSRKLNHSTNLSFPTTKAMIVTVGARSVAV